MTKYLPKTRSHWSVPGFCLVALAVAVFVWGLAYKLSLYDPPQASSHRMVAAKLLSNRERPATAKVEFQDALNASSLTASQVAVSTFLALFLPLLLADKARHSWTMFRVASSRKRPCFADIPHHFFRPPPPRLR